MEISGSLCKLLVKPETQSLNSRNLTTICKVVSDLTEIETLLGWSHIHFAPCNYDSFE
jgi:hypothetical protein